MARASRMLFGIAIATLLAGCGDDGESTGASGPGTEFQQDCFVRFEVTSAGSFASLHVELDYADAPGRFVGAGHDVECARLDDRLAVYATNCGEPGGCYFGVRPFMTIQAASAHDIATPLELLECRFLGSAVPTADDFDLEVIEASDEDLYPLTKLPLVSITQIECRDTSATTTTSTTLPDPCSDVTCLPGEACRDGSCFPVTAYEIDFALETPVELGALQYSVFYDCAYGVFVGERDDVRCVPNPSINGYSIFNDLDCGSVIADGELAAAVTSIPGFVGPLRVATCEFVAAAGTTPAPGDFTIEVIDASDTDLRPVRDVRVGIQAIRPIAR